MDVQEIEGSSTLKGAAKVFAKQWLESSWQIQGVPGFITTTHRDECSLCEQYAEHAVAASEKPMVELPSHQIELAFRTAWPRVVEHIEDNAMDDVLLFTVQTHIQWCRRSRTGIKSFGDRPPQASAYMHRNLSILNVVIFGLVVILS